jgi:fucose 4-O-acetylase-like acetyltransferase
MPIPRARQSAEAFLYFQCLLFHGLFFFISGYFYPQSFDRHGARKFIADKLIRFGIPLVLAYLFMTPLLEYAQYVLDVPPISLQDFYMRIWQTAGLRVSYPYALNYGHLWFVEHLLSMP